MNGQEESLLFLARQLLPGFWVTLEITVAAAVLAIACSVAAGLGRLSDRAWVRWLAGAYVESFRGMSALILLFWLYFALPALGLELAAIPVAILGLGLHIGGYGAEVVRGALLAVPRGQVEAAKALNMSPLDRLRYVVLPQAVVAMLPPMGNLMIELMKATALVSLITVSDLTFMGQLLRQLTLQTPEIFGLLLVMYFVIALGIVGVFRALEWKLGAWRRVGGQ